MVYYATLENYFVDINTFNKNTTHLNYRNRWGAQGPLLPDNLASNNPSPFIIGGMLYHPIVVGLNNSAANGAGGVVGFVRAKVSNNLELGDSEYMVCSSEDLKKAGVRLSVQSIKMLKSLRHNSKLHKNESEIRHYNIQGFKCRPEEIIKCLAFKYLDFPSDRSFIETLAHASRDASYTLQELVLDKHNDMQTICAAVAKHFRDTERSYWSNRTIGTKVSYVIMRTTLDIDEKCVVKWRRPGKNSKWPYTLDHHWFCCQESSVSMAHHTMASLMFTASSTSSRTSGWGATTATRDQLMMNLPIFLGIRALDTCRKILENFFVNIVEIMKTNSTATGHYTNLINDFDWPVPNRYSGKRLEAEMFPVKAALTMGVLPKFDESGRFDKFIPIDGVLHKNPKTIYIEVDSDYLKRRRPEHSLLLMYSTGIISLEDLEKILGSISQNDKDLENNSTKVQLRMSKNVVCCLPIESASKKIYETLTKSGYNYPGVNGSNPSKLNNKVPDLTDRHQLEEIEEYIDT